MTNWLQKFLSPQNPTRRSNLPMQVAQRMMVPRTGQQGGKQTLPNASIIYAVAASVLVVAALFLLFSGAWFSALLVLLPAICFLGFAVHFIRHQ